MKTCVSIDCLFIGFCNAYDNSVDRTGGCTMQKWIVSQAEKHNERNKKVQKIAQKKTRSQKGRKYNRKCGICGKYHEQSEMVRDYGSDTGWICDDCARTLRPEDEEFGEY